VQKLLFKKLRSRAVKNPKRLQIQQYHSIENHKVSCTQTLCDILNQSISYNHGIFLKLQKKILCIQTGPCGFWVACMSKVLDLLCWTGLVLIVLARVHNQGFKQKQKSTTVSKK
jgi:hypothetical protein